MVKRDRSKEALEREVEWKQVNGELGELRAEKKGTSEAKKGLHYQDDRPVKGL